jgi:hypothetical protein
MWLAPAYPANPNVESYVIECIFNINQSHYPDDQVYLFSEQSSCNHLVVVPGSIAIAS